jgi:hypothetical protein
MSKQDIEKRLGFAAQGVKETTRTSAKAAFASPKYRAFVYRGSPSNNVLVKATEFMDSASAAEDAAKQIVMSFRGKPGYPSNNYFADIAQETPEGAKTVKNNIRFSRPGVKAKMALTIYTVGAKNACYEALSNMNALAQLASETNSGWDFHVTVMTDHVKNAMSKLESSPAQAGEYLSRAIDTLGMLRKIDPKRLNDNQKGSFKQLIGYVAKSLRDARANIKVVSTSSRPGVKAKFADAALNQIRNNAAISDKIRTLVSKGLSVPQAIDSVLGEGTYKRIGSEVYDELRKDKSSRPGAKASFEKEYVLWGLPKGETDRLHEKVLSTQAKTPAQMEDVKKRAAAAGWHSFRVQILDLSKPYKGFSRPGAKAKA